MKDIIQEHWKNEELIGIDCIVKSDGKVILLNCYKVNENDVYKHYAIPLCETSISSLLKYNNEIWTMVETFTNTCVLINDDKVFGGEGGMGNEGFIACTNRENELLWAFFFSNSNPFYKLELNDNLLSAFSSYDLRYEINLNDLESISITPCTWR